ncbi:AraC family transcriptional regulator [Aquabacterium soli]|uniref:AraC family transcriptional regulator n=1 Tax=Aquabacterium soli TaxID=2493092 RepID=A0A3R8U326_9BURK|nr:AraC family transcriptional regulator [Aquabacterium soli]RRS03664.1 AraC family transcriptional regulator [Aquabacterium soli]
MSTSHKLPPWDFRRGIATARVLVQLGLDKGAGLDALLQQTGITRQMLDDPKAEIEATQEIQLIRNLLSTLGHPPELGLEAGQRYRLTTYGLWGYAVLSSPTLGDAIHLTRRMLNQTFSLTRNVAVQEGDQIIITHMDEHLPPDVRQFIIDRDRAAITVLQREILGRPLSYTAFEMKHSEPEPGMAARYTDWVGIRPIFGCQQHRSIFPVALMSEPLPQAEPHTARLCEEMCRKLVEARSSRTGVAAAVRDRLLRTPGHIPDMEEISSEMHMTSRTLRRHLTAEGATFRALLEEVRSTLATELMANARLTHAEIAQRLGYADVTTFIEAFRRWKGVPPSEYRRQQGLRTSATRASAFRTLVITPPGHEAASSNDAEADAA